MFMGLVAPRDAAAPATAVEEAADSRASSRSAAQLPEHVPIASERRRWSLGGSAGLRRQQEEIIRLFFTRAPRAYDIDFARKATFTGLADSIASGVAFITDSRRRHYRLLSRAAVSYLQAQSNAVGAAVTQCCRGQDSGHVVISAVYDDTGHPVAPCPC